MTAPYRLKLLGGLGFDGPKELSGRVTQRRQMALLALLAAHETPRSRDKLIGLLWPETDNDRARHLLSDSVYIIRKELGDTAIDTGTEGVSLNSAVIGSDLTDFRAAIANELHEDALTSYGGSFLDGFFPDESEPYERWMMDKREALQREAARAAWALVDQAEAAGEVHEAIRWAQRALKIVPEDEQGVRRLIRLHDERGDRAGAVRAYEEFATWLQTELDVEPSQETQSLIAAIREPVDAGRKLTDQPVDVLGADDAPRATPAKRRPVWVAAAVLAIVAGAWLVVPRSETGSSPSTTDIPPSVAVLPFEIRGEGLDIWREGMVDLLSTNVDVFSDVRAVPSRTVLARWRETAIDEPAELASALEVARGIDASYAITGSVIAIEKGLRLRGELFDLQTGTKLTDAVAEGAADSILAIVDHLSVELMGPLLTSPAGSGTGPGLTRLTTSSPAALHAFLEGEKFLRAAEYQPAVEAYERAVEIDSTFALAYSRLVVAYSWTTAGEGAFDASRLALQYADRLPEREARLVRARYAAYNETYPEFFKILREAVRQHPDDSEAWYELGEAYYHVGDQMLIRPWEFVDAFERSIALDPFFAPAYEHLVDAAFLHEPDSAHASAILEQLLEAAPDKETERIAFDLVFGDPETRNEARLRLRDVSPTELRAMSQNLLSHPRHLSLREIALRTALERAAPNQGRAIRLLLAWTLMARGHVDAAIEFADDPVLSRDRATMLYQAHTFGYPIPAQTLAAALAASFSPIAPEAAKTSDWETAAPVLFERAAHAATNADWPVFARARNQLRALTPTLNPENAIDTIGMGGLIQVLDGYAAWQRGDREAALQLLRSSQVRTTGGHPILRWIIGERNQITRAWLGHLLFEMNQPREALVYYESLGPGWPFGQDPMIYFHLGRVRDDLGDREGALRAYELAAVAWQDPHPSMRPFAETARSEAARLRGLIRQ